MLSVNAINNDCTYSMTHLIQTKIKFLVIFLKVGGMCGQKCIKPQQIFTSSIVQERPTFGDNN